MAKYDLNLDTQLLHIFTNNSFEICDILTKIRSFSLFQLHSLIA